MSTLSLHKRFAAACPGRVSGFAYLRFVLRVRTRLSAHRTWFKLLDMPELRTVVRRDPAVVLRLQRCYLSNGLTFRQRQRVLHSQFGLLARHPEEVLASIYGGDGLLLASFNEEGVDHRIALHHLPTNAREGELSVVWDSSEGRLGCISFVIAHGKLEQRAAVIGGLQGPCDERALEQNRQLTKAMHGLRPMAAMVQAVAAVSEAYGATRLLAVTDAHHALSGRKASTRQKKKLSYDALWAEMDARPAPAGLVDLPLRAPERTAEEIPVRKRALYRRRYALLARLREDISANMAWAQTLPSPAVLNALERAHARNYEHTSALREGTFVFD